MILHGARRRVSPGLIDDHVFLCMAGVGLDAHVLAELSLGLKRGLGKSAYVWAGLRALRRLRLPPLVVWLDGTPVAAVGVIVARTRFYGGRFVVVPSASLTAPELSVCLFKRGSRVAALRYCLGIGLGCHHRFGDIDIRQARGVRIESADPSPYHTDGDLRGSLPIGVDVAPRALMLVYPAGV